MSKSRAGKQNGYRAAVRGKGKSMKKKIIVVELLISMLTTCLTGCTEADRVSQNVSNEADNFNICRQITVINNKTDTILYQFEGFSSIKSDNADSQLEIISEVADGEYKKDYIYLNNNTTYVVKETDSVNVDKYHYQWYILPKGNVFNTTFKVSD